MVQRESVFLILLQCSHLVAY